MSFDMVKGQSRAPAARRWPGQRVDPSKADRDSERPY